LSSRFDYTGKDDFDELDPQVSHKNGAERNTTTSAQGAAEDRL
jgi:hypothetical protein